jgi:hypothetical protein
MREGEKGKQKQGKKCEESCPESRGKISLIGFYC